MYLYLRDNGIVQRYQIVNKIEKIPKGYVCSQKGQLHSIYTKQGHDNIILYQDGDVKLLIDAFSLKYNQIYLKAQYELDNPPSLFVRLYRRVFGY